MTLSASTPPLAARDMIGTAANDRRGYAPAPHRATGEPWGVIVVDDEEMLAEELAGALRRDGWAARHFAAGLAALDGLAAAPGVTVLVSDLSMPGIDGLSLARQVASIREERLAVSVVLITANATPADIDSARGAGISAIVNKPFRLTAIREAVRAAHRQALVRRHGAEAPWLSEAAN